MSDEADLQLYFEKETALEIYQYLEAHPGWIERDELLRAVESHWDDLYRSRLDYWNTAIERVAAQRKLWLALNPSPSRERRLALLDELENMAHTFLSEEIARQERE